MRSVTATEAYTRKLREQKVHIGEAIKQRHLFNKVVQEQIDLQRAQVVSSSRMADGRVVSEMFIPRDAVRRTQMMRTQLGVLNETLRSAAENTVKWGKNTQWAGRQLMVGFTVPLAIAAAATGKLAYDVDKALTSITKVYGDATDQFQHTAESIREASWQTAKNMSALYGQSAKDTLEITAQFAAAGATGIELQQATAAATKARMLNEIDLQTAIQASISLQTVYQMSSEELGQTWEYINAVANQTILSAEDFAVAIPKVGGLFKELGADIKDVGVYMTAMAAGGIEAAEGANALKTIAFRAVAPYDKGIETFDKATGARLKDLIHQAKGEIVPLLDLMIDKMGGLDRETKTQVFKDVFGIHQGNKALILMNQLADKSGQVAQAIAVGENSIADNAAIANQELARMNEQPYKKIEKSIQGIKNEMAELGKVVLPIANWFLESIQGIMKWINTMDDSKRIALLGAAAFIALAGVGTMLIGLFANLAGQMGKATTIIGGMITQFKFLTPEQKAQELLAKQAANAYDIQTASVSRLTLALQEMAGALNATAAAGKVVKQTVKPQQMGVVPEGTAYVQNYTKRRDAAGNLIPYKQMASYKEDRQGNMQSAGAVSNARWKALEKEHRALGKVEEAEGKRLAAIKATNDAMLVQQKRFQGIVAGAAGATMTLGVLGSMFGPQEGVGAAISKTLIGVGLLASIMPGLIAKFVLWAKTAIMSSNLVVTSLVRVRTAAFAAGAAMKAAALPLTLLAAAIAGFWYKAKQDGEAAAEAFKAIADSAQTWGEVLNFNVVDPGKMITQQASTGRQAAEGLAETFRKSNQAAFDALQASGEGKSMGEKWAIAINEGVKVKLAGGTAEAAKQATRVALQIMQGGLDDADFEAQINLKVNFEDNKSVINSAVAGVSEMLNSAAADEGSGWENFARNWFVGQEDLSALGKENAVQAAQQFNTAYISSSAEERKKMFETLYKEQSADIRAYYDRLSKEYKDKVSYEDFFKELSSPSFWSTDASMAVQSLGLTKDDQGLYRATEKMNAFAAEFVKLRGLVDEVGENPTWEQLMKYLNSVNGGMSATEVAGEKMAKGMNEAQEAAEDLINALKGAGIDMDPEKAIDKYRQVVEGVQGDMIDFAENAWDAHVDSAMAGLDRAADAAEKKAADRQDALEARQEAAQDRLKDKQDKRRKAIEDSYDARIKKIDDAMKAEEEADALRQKLFEREKTRMQRYSTLFSKNVDLNAAITGGNLDEAAKIAQDVQTQQDTWNMEDANGAAGDASAKRKAALEAQKSKLDEAKQARLDALKIMEEAEDKALEARQKREDKALKASIDADKRRMDNLKRNRQAELDADKRLLDQKIAAIRAYVPKNAEEMAIQQKQIEKAYKEYGVTFTQYGKEWSGIIGKSFKSQTAIAANQIKTEVAWKSIGSDISNQLLKGGFGMDAKSFAKWMNGGAAPSGSLFNPKPMGYGDRQGGSFKDHGKHDGGIVGKTPGSRTGYSGKQQAQSEVWVNALKGEGILNRKATDMIGEENIMALNKGKLPADTGPWGPTAGIAGMAAAVQGAAIKRVMGQTVQAISSRMAGEFTMDSAASKPGKYAGIELNSAQMHNAGLIMNVGRSMGASLRDIQIALMTAMQESSLRNLSGGDRDSVGLFQQRPSQGWGSVEEIMDPTYASKKFYSALFKVKDRDKMSMSQAAQKVQRSAFPNAYAKWQQMARAVLAAGATGYNGFGANIDIARMMGGNAGGFAGAPGAGGWVKPAAGKVTSEYGMRVNPVTGVYKLHGGIDIGAPAGTPIYAAKRGMVTMADYYPSLGNYVRVDHGGGIQTGYAHQSKIRTKVGALVNAGQRLGDVGTTGNSTGNHLHFEYWRGGSRQNPRQIIPKFAEGGYTLSSGLGMLHPKETVLSKPLSEDLKSGLNKFANDGGSRYDVTIDLRGSHIASDVDVEKAVNNALDKRERKLGRSRRMGDNK